MGTQRHARAAAVGGALLVVGFVVVALGQGFLSPDERLAAAQAVAVAKDEPASLPHADLASQAFLPMGSGSAEDRIEGGVTPAFVSLFSVPARWSERVYAFHAWAAFWSAVAVVALGLFARRCFSPQAAAPAMIALASAPPFLFWSTFAMANIPALAAGLLMFVALATYADTGRARFLVASIALTLLAVSLRRDAIVLLGPFIVVCLLMAARKPVLLVVAAVTSYGAFGAYRLAVGLAPSWATAWWMDWTDVRLAWGSITDRYGSYSPDFSWAMFAENAQEFGLSLYPVLALVGAAGWLLLPLRDRAAARVTAAFTLATLAFAFAAFSINATIIADPPRLFSSLPRYSLILPAALALGAATLLPRAAKLVARPPAARVVAVACVAMLAVPGVVQATFEDPGLLWMREQREWRAERNAIADSLPDNAYLIADEDSKHITTRPVLAPINANKPLAVVLPALIDRLAEQRGLRAFIHGDSYNGDWSGVLGEYVTDRHHTTVEVGTTGYLEVWWTNTSLTNVGILGIGGWNVSESGWLEATSDFSRFRATPNLAANLREAPSPGFLFQFVVVDADAGRLEFGYINEPGRTEDIIVLGSWQGNATGDDVAVEVVAPPDTVVNGWFFVRGPALLRQLSVTATS